MNKKPIYLLALLSFFLTNLIIPVEPCLKVREIVPTYLNSWSDLERREYPDCNDSTKYYSKFYAKDLLTHEGNIINHKKEGIWKYYIDGNYWFEKSYFHNQEFKSTNGDLTQIIINDSISYEMWYSNGKLTSGGLSKNSLNIGIWEELDSTGEIRSYGKYSGEIICDTISSEDKDPPYLIRDTIICYQRKDSTWLYFDSKNKLIRTELYNKGVLIK